LLYTAARLFRDGDFFRRGPQPGGPRRLGRPRARPAGFALRPVRPALVPPGRCQWVSPGGWVHGVPPRDLHGPALCNAVKLKFMPPAPRRPANGNGLPRNLFRLARPRRRTDGSIYRRPPEFCHVPNSGYQGVRRKNRKNPALGAPAPAAGPP